MIRIIYITKFDTKNYSIVASAFKGKEKKKLYSKALSEIKKSFNSFFDNNKFDYIYCVDENKNAFYRDDIIYLSKETFEKQINSEKNNFFIYNAFGNEFISNGDLVEDLIESLGENAYSSLPMANSNYLTCNINREEDTYKNIMKLYNNYLYDDLNTYDNFDFQNFDFLYVNSKFLDEYKLDFKNKTFFETIIDWFYYIRSLGVNSSTRTNHLMFKFNYHPIYQVNHNIQSLLLSKWQKEYLYQGNHYLSNSYQFVDFINNKKQDELLLQSKESILYLTTPFNWKNGMTKHVKDLIKGIKGKYIYVLDTSPQPRYNNKFTLYKFFDGVQIDIEFIFIPVNSSISNVNDRSYYNALKKILIDKNIGLVHSHITSFGHSHNFVDVCEELGIKSYISLHDLYYLGGEYTQTNVDIQYDSDLLLEKYGISDINHFDKVWHSSVQNMFDKVDKIISYNDKYYDIFSKFYSIEKNKFTVIEHGLNVENRYDLSDRTLSKNLKIIYFGRIREEKGLTTILKLAKLKPNYKIYILGTPDDGSIMNELSKLKNIKYLGSYNSFEQLINKVYKIKPHLKIIPANWEEAFNFTLSESYQLGIIPIVSSLGALESRTIKNNIGYMFNNSETYTIHKNKLSYPDNIDNLLEVLNKIENTTNDEWNKNIDDVIKLHLQSTEEMINSHLDIYDIKKHVVIESTLNRNIFKQSFASEDINNVIDFRYRFQRLIYDRLWSMSTITFRIINFIKRFM